MRHSRPGMGIATTKTVQNKIVYSEYLRAYSNISAADARESIDNFFTDDANVKISHPINDVQGGAGYYDEFMAPLMAAFAGLQRQDYIVIGGEYLGDEWVTSTGYFYGHFNRPLFGIPPSGKMAFLRYGEFLKVKDNRVVEAEVFLGLAELIISLGAWPLGPSQGYEGLVPGPATADGKVLEAPKADRSKGTADFVEAMLLRLATEEKEWKPYWDERMVWYGPGGFGTYSTLDAFEAFQAPFEKSFEGWGDGLNEGLTGIGSSCKAGDGDYAFLSGWPQITGVHVKPFMGIEPTGKRVYMRDCDWWRLSENKILENWCMVDTLHLALQLGRDVIEEIRE